MVRAHQIFLPAYPFQIFILASTWGVYNAPHSMVGIYALRFTFDKLRILPRRIQYITNIIRGSSCRVGLGLLIYSSPSRDPLGGIPFDHHVNAGVNVLVFR